MLEYRVIDLQSDVIEPEAQIVTARSPEHAAEVALGLSLVRSGAGRQLRARVYFQNPGFPLNMVRLYSKTADRRPVS